MLALGGHDVSGFDVNPKVRDALRRGAENVGESEVRSLVLDALATGKLKIADAIDPADAFIICVPTPNAPDGRPNLSYVHDATTALATSLKRGDLIILGAIVRELKSNSRITGGKTRQAAERARELYASFVDAEMYETDCMTAELVKVIENTFRDVNIALANELALLCEELDVDAWEAI